MNKTLLIIDSFALIHRAFHAFPDSLVTTKGEVVNVTYGFASLILDTLIKFKPTHVVFVFDPPGPTSRNLEYTEYKANRGPTEKSMTSQLPRVREFIKTLGVPLLEVNGFEADDVIGSLTAKYEQAPGSNTIIVTGDRDLFQLVDDQTSVYLAGQSFSQSKLFDAAGVLEKMGVTPAQIVDFKGLCGDASDNIPGVAGIGSAGAVGLLKQFKTLDNLYAQIDQVPNRYKTKLVNGHDNAYLSQKLARIITDVPIVFDFDEGRFDKFDYTQIEGLFKELEFKTLNRKLEKLASTYAVKPLETKKAAEPLFDNSLPIWDGQRLSEQVALYVEISGEDAPRKQAAKLILATGDKEYLVQDAQLEELRSQLGDQLVATNDAKGLYQILGQDLNAFDVVLALTIMAGGAIKPNFADIASYYNCEAFSFALCLLKLKGEFDARASKMPDTAKLISVEQGTSKVLAQMELSGIKVDDAQLNKFGAELESKLAELQSGIFADVGHEFNIASPKQVGEVLFGERGLPGGRKNKSGGYSTNERVLKDLVADPVVEKILSFREVSKLLSTYVRPMPSYINPVTSRIHGNFNQLGAITGRFSSDRPNLQNIPIRDELGQSIRKAFVAEEGRVLVSFDYSQQELRILAHLAKEEKLLHAFATDQDVHTITAADLFGIKPEAVDSQQRRVGKTVNYGIVYGMGAYGLADRLKIPPKQATEFVKTYYERYPTIKAYFDNLIANASKEEFVYTIMGRPRSTAMLKADNFMVREAARREIMNFPLQGSAADFMKVAMVSVGDVIKDSPAQLVLQIHDELLFEYDLGGKSIADTTQSAEFHNFTKNVYNAMLNAANLSVPLEVEAKLGLNWLSMDQINLK